LRTPQRRSADILADHPLYQSFAHRLRLRDGCRKPVVLAMVVAGGDDTYAVRGTQLVVYGKNGQQLVSQS
jgi:hypothetical protein